MLEPGTIDEPAAAPLDRGLPYRARPKALIVAVAAIAAGPVLATGVAEAATRGATSPPDRNTLTVKRGQTVTISSTRRLRELRIEAGGAIAAPSGHSLSLVVNGREIGSKLDSLYDDDGIATAIAAGTYRGDVVIDVATENVVSYNDRSWPFRQALYVGPGGVDTGRSVLPAVTGGTVRDSFARGITVLSEGQAFDGVYVSGATYRLTAPRFRFNGNGRCDFIGYGSAIVATDGGTLVVDGARIDNTGVVRTAVVADGGASVVVKNSRIRTRDGEPPAEYENTGDTSFMMTCPWMLGIYGTVRSTNLVGTETKATYLNTSVVNDNWGLLSVDGGKDCTLVAVNCRLRHTGTSGYGTYAIGHVTEHLLGNVFDVATYASIIWGGASLHYGDSSPEIVRKLNEENALGLTRQDIASVRRQSTVVNSRRFGFMWQSTGPLLIDGGTQITTRETVFLSKATASAVTVDGSQGARLSTRNGVIYQLMDNDNPGHVDSDDTPWSTVYTASYVQPTDPADKSSSFDPAVAHTTDASGSFSDIELHGDFYNGVLGGGVGGLQGMNLVLTFTGARVHGVISASTAVHEQSPIGFSNYEQLGVVRNTPSAVVNNGVLVTLAGASRWHVTGTSYLSALTIGPKASIVGPDGTAPTMTVDGAATTITPGKSYTGAIKLSV